MSDSEHLKEVAPFPWKSYKHHSRLYLYRLVDAQGLTVLFAPGKEGTGTGDRAKEVAEYVLHAANSHEKLVDAIQDAVDHCEVCRPFLGEESPWRCARCQTFYGLLKDAKRSEA